MKRIMCLQEMEIRRPNMITADQYRSIKAPTMVVWTSHDPTATPEEGKQIADMIPGSKFVVMNRCGHWPQFEDAEHFNRTPHRFFAWQRLRWPRSTKTSKASPVRSERPMCTAPISPIRTQLIFQEVDTAYEIQEANTSYWLSQGRRIVGCKIGLTSPAVQKQLRVNQPDFGILFADMQVGEDEQDRARARSATKN